MVTAFVILAMFNYSHWAAPYVLLDACSSLRWQCQCIALQWSDCFTVNFYLELYQGGKEVEAVKKKS